MYQLYHLSVFLMKDLDYDLVLQPSKLPKDRIHPCKHPHPHRGSTPTRTPPVARIVVVLWREGKCETNSPGRGEGGKSRPIGSFFEKFLSISGLRGRKKPTTTACGSHLSKQICYSKKIIKHQPKKPFIFTHHSSLLQKVEHLVVTGSL